MNSPCAHSATQPPSALPLLVHAWTRTVAHAMQAAARLMDTWLKARQRTGDDRDILDAMSDRERRDIGLPPSGRRPEVERWVGGWRGTP